MNDLVVGDKFTMEVMNRSKLNRFLYWLLKRPIPMKLAKFTVQVVMDSQVAIKPLIMDKE